MKKTKVLNDTLIPLNILFDVVLGGFVKTEIYGVKDNKVRFFEIDIKPFSFKKRKRKGYDVIEGREGDPIYLSVE